MSKLKILELFGGIGACSKALEKLGIDYEIVDYVEIDKYAVLSFNAIHNTNFQPQDVCEWNKQIDVDLVMHGSPCQDFSISGKQAGGDEGSGTRSSLMYETLRIVESLKPKYVIWENVKNLISKKHKHNYDNYCNKMSGLGYRNYGQILNAKDYGIPQNRERVFTISIRKDIDKSFTFPPKRELKLRLKDLLEDNVDEKYYLSEENIQQIVLNKPIRQNNYMPEVLAGIGEKDSNSNTQWKQQNIIYNNKIALSLSTMYAPYYLIKNANSKGYIEAADGDGIDLSQPNSKTKRGRVQKEISNTITTQNCLGVVDNLRIRRLIPLETWRLMGFDDEDYEKASKVCSNVQLYKQAGNSIVVNVLMAIFKELL